MLYLHTFKKLWVTQPAAPGKPMVQEVLLEKLDNVGNLKTVKVLRERPATEKELGLSMSGYGWMVRF